MAIFRSLRRVANRLYRRLFRRRLDARTRDIAHVLQSVSAFEHLSSRSRYAIADLAHQRTYRRGESIYYEGDPGLGLYVVESGRVRLKTFGESDQPHELSEIEPTGMFGTLSLLGDLRRLETAEAMTETQVLGFFRPDLQNIVRRDPKSGAEIAMALARAVAAQHVEMLGCIEERSGRAAAMDAYASAATNISAEASPS